MVKKPHPLFPRPGGQFVARVLWEIGLAGKQDSKKKGSECYPFWILDDLQAFVGKGCLGWLVLTSFVFVLLQRAKLGRRLGKLCGSCRVIEFRTLVGDGFFGFFPRSFSGGFIDVVGTQGGVGQ